MAEPAFHVDDPGYEADEPALDRRVWHKNRGYKPDGSAGRRVRVKLGHGREPRYADTDNPMLPPGWAANTTRWTLTGDEHDVIEFMIL